MEKMSGLSEFMPFSRLIDKTKRGNAIIRKFEDDLRLYANLRNAIVHNRTDADYAIAEPHDDIVQLIEYIDRELAKPVTVGELFRTKVHTLKVTDLLSTGLDLIRKQRFNQIPIYSNGEFIGLVTATGIMYWLADECPGGVISREMPTLLDIYHHEKRKNTYRFVSQDLSVYEAEDYLTYISEGIPVGAEIPWRHQNNMDDVPTPSVADGEEFYQQSCIACHAGDGSGTGSNSGPALWGEGSFNDGAGIARMTKMAGYIQNNMPIGAENTLSDQEASDLAAYLLSQDRPEWKNHDKDWSTGNRPTDIMTKDLRQQVKDGTIDWDEVLGKNK